MKLAILVVVILGFVAVTTRLDTIITLLRALQP